MRNIFMRSIAAVASILSGGGGGGGRFNPSARELPFEPLPTGARYRGTRPARPTYSDPTVRIEARSDMFPSIIPKAGREKGKGRDCIITKRRRKNPFRGIVGNRRIKGPYRELTHVWVVESIKFV